MPHLRSKISMSDEEVDEFTHQRLTATVCSVNHDGTIHAVAMWYGFTGGRIAFHTKAKSQKAINLTRSPATTFLVEDGHQYDQLRGVELVGQAVVVDDPGQRLELARSVLERYFDPGVPLTEAMLEGTLHNRVVLALDVRRVVSWDHRKLGQAAGRGQERTKEG
jgi:PPOX class probable F420-dependent enzyme